MTDIKQQLAPGWSPANIIICVVLVLMNLWPLSLVMVAYIVWGNKVGLDLSQPQTLGVFAKRLGIAWRAALESFSGKQR